MEGECSEDESISKHFGAAHAARLEKVKALAQEGRALALANMAMPTRSQCIAVRMLLRHAEYCEKAAEMFIALAKGENEAAFDLWERFRHSFGLYEYELERYFDHYQALWTLGSCIPKDVRSLKQGE